LSRGDGSAGRSAFEADEELAALRSSLAQSDKLLHELRVHQIELEIQNRALREAQEELETSRERYVELFDLAPSAYLTLETDGRILEANLAAERLLGQERTALLGRRVQTLVGLSDPLAFRSLLQQSVAVHGEIRSEITFRTSTHQTFTVEMVILPIFKGQGAGQVRIALHDVTARSIAQQNLLFLNQAGARLARIPLGAPQMLDEIAAAGAFGAADGCLVELAGAESVAWRSEPIRRRMVGHALEALRLQIAPSVRQATAGGACSLGRWSDDLGPRPFWSVIRSWVSAPLVVDGKVRGSVTLFQHFGLENEDSAQVLAEEFARRVSMVLDNTALFRRAEEATRARDEMMAVLAHDLSNALFSFRLHAQRGLSRGGEQSRRALGAVARGSQWLLGLVKTVLEVAGIEGGAVKVQPQPGNLAEVLESACLLQQMDADERKLDVVRAWPEELPVEFDQERLLQVVFNLVNNAVKFTPSGGRIEVGASRAKGQVQVWVQDSGKGLDPAELERVFERGWQADPKAGGKGLGLYISRRIVEAHGGKMWVESAPGRGATFNLMLPVAVADSVSQQDEASLST
jgi:PAS domain S-box-containing protein